MTFRRPTRKVAAIVTLIAFLSQGMLALAATGSHPAATPAQDRLAINLDAHPHHHAPAETPTTASASETACEDDRQCLCCIGSCASVLLSDAEARKDPQHPDLLSFSQEFFITRQTDTPYRPPIAL
jgi:hypothetical protein